MAQRVWNDDPHLSQGPAAEVTPANRQGMLAIPYADECASRLEIGLAQFPQQSRGGPDTGPQ